MFMAFVGCQFIGNREELSNHKSVCAFKDELQLVAAIMKEVGLATFFLQMLCVCLMYG